MSFTDSQVRKLRARVRPQFVKEREVEGKTLHYLEGWHLIAEANRIFGFDAWDRETVSSQCVWQKQVDHRFAAAYLTRVKITVRAGDRLIVREGLGSGEALAGTPGQAHERASKAAETDATKRALSTFGNSFGLSLYKGTPPAEAKACRPKPACAKTETLGVAEPPASSQFTCEAPQSSNPVDEPATQPVEEPPERRGAQPVQSAAREVVALPVLLPPGVPAPTGQIDKSALAFPEPKRIRDRDHLRFVARQPCLVCGRTPSQAHHLRIAQPRALGRKVSDEFTVPLCALHHHELHMRGNEAQWWADRNIDPLPIADELWAQRGSDRLVRSPPDADLLVAAPSTQPHD